MVALLLILSLLAALSLLASDLSRGAAWPLAAAALALGGWRARREWRRPARSFVFGRDAEVVIEGEPVSHFALHWRGPLAFAQWRDRDGRRHAASWWPDTLPASARRELRLAAPVAADARNEATMAP